MFGAISGYKDADSLVLKCDEMLENIYLSLLEQKQAAKTEADLSIVLRDFKKLGNYKDSAKIRKELAEKIISLSYAPIINKAKYKLKLAISPQEVDEAFNMLQGFNGIPEVTQILKDKERYIIIFGRRPYAWSRLNIKYYNISFIFQLS